MLAYYFRIAIKSLRRNPMLTALAWTIYALVIAVIMLALLYIARDFIAHHTGYPVLGAKPK